MKLLGIGLLALAVAGCGAVVIKDDEVIRALSLSKPAGRNTYSVAGDPFCEIRTQILTSKKLVDPIKQRRSMRKLLVTNPAGTVGVIGIAPFESSCRAQVQKGLALIR